MADKGKQRPKPPSPVDFIESAPVRKKPKRTSR